MIITLDTKRFPNGIPADAKEGDEVGFTLVGRIGKLEPNDIDPSIIEATIYITEITPGH